MRRTCLPAEVEDFMRQLAPLPTDRRNAAVAMLCEVVADCPVCDGPIRRTDPRRLGGGRLVHLRCSGGGS